MPDDKKESYLEKRRKRNKNKPREEKDRENELKRIRRFTREFGDKHLITLEQLMALTPDKLKEESEKWQKQAFDAKVGYEAYLVEKGALNSVVIEARKEARAQMTNARFVTKMAKKAGIPITLLAGLGSIRYSNQEKMHMFVIGLYQEVDDIFEEFALMLIDAEEGEGKRLR